MRPVERPDKLGGGGCLGVVRAVVQNSHLAQVPIAAACMLLAYLTIPQDADKTYSRQGLAEIDFGGSLTLLLSVSDVGGPSDVDDERGPSDG